MQDESSFITDVPTGLFSIPEGERERLGEALQALLSTGSINGLDPSRTALYHWCRQYFDWLKEVANLSGLDVALLHEERLVQAVPRIASLRLRLKQDATLVWLALWYAADVCWRDEGQDQAFISVGELNDLIQNQLLPNAVSQLSKGNLRDILRQAARFHIIRFELSDPFEESSIEILPTIRRIIPFRDLSAWAETAAAFQKEVSAQENEPSTDSTEGEDEP